MNILDLFCCEGGASKGYHDAGFTVTGVDIESGGFYPYTKIQKDFRDLDTDWIKSNFDAIHASPPCQAYTWSSKAARNRGKTYPDHMEATKKLLYEVGLPYIIENVPNAPMRRDLVLCGEMFGLRVIRHRWFEIHGFIVPQPEHVKHKPPIMNKNGNRRSWYMCFAGNGGAGHSYRKEDRLSAMGTEWIKDWKYMKEAIPPAYTSYIGKYLLESLKR